MCHMTLSSGLYAPVDDFTLVKRGGRGAGGRRCQPRRPSLRTKSRYDLGPDEYLVVADNRDNSLEGCCENP